MKIIPSLPVLAFGLMLAGTITPAVAVDFPIQGNSILRAYSFYCDPTYYEGHKLGDGQWDPDLADSYGRMLLVRFNADCNSFFHGMVAAIDFADQLIADSPELQRDGGGELSEGQLQALGKQRWLAEYIETAQCGGDLDRGLADQAPLLAPYWGQVGAADALNIAIGYVSMNGRSAADTAAGNGDAACRLATGAVFPVVMDLMTQGMLTPDQLGLAPPPAADGIPPGLTPGQQSSRDALEQFEQYGHEMQRQAEAERSRPADNPDAVEALTKLSGWWRDEDVGNGCNDTDNQYRLALGSWHRDDRGEIVFGEGPFVVGMYDDWCNLSDLSLTGNSIRFHGACMVEGEESSGAGSITMTGSDAAVVKLPYLDTGFTVRACPVSEHVSANASPLSRMHERSTVPTSQPRQVGPFSATSQISTFLVSMVGKLPRGPYRQEQDACISGAIVPTTPAGRYVRDRGWGVIAEQPIGNLQLVAFAGELIEGTSGTCAIRQGNVAVFAGDRLQAVLYTGKKSDELIGQLKPKEDGEVRLWSGEYLPRPVADLAVDDNALTVKQLSASEPFCSGTASVPNVYDMPITEAREQLQAAGWQPVPQPKEDWGQQPHLQDMGVTEAETCSGTGMAFCSYTYRGQDSALHVTTAGELDEDHIPAVAFYDLDCMGS